MWENGQILNVTHNTIFMVKISKDVFHKKEAPMD